MKSHVQLALVAAFAVLALVGWQVGGSSPAIGMAVTVVGAVALGGYGWWALRRGRHTAWESARTRIAPGHAVVFWKPGCPFCERLLRQLRGDTRVTWVNVWHDDEAQSRVCELNGGDEYVPTALVGEEVLRNPSAAQLVAALR